MREYYWVRAGRRRWRDIAPRIRHVVIVGLSYWPCDREELDEFISALPRDARIYMANPSPPHDWLQRLSQRFGADRVRCWTSGPGALFGEL